MTTQAQLAALRGACSAYGDALQTIRAAQVNLDIAHVDTHSLVDEVLQTVACAQRALARQITQLEAHHAQPCAHPAASHEPA